jgi:site-specific DNA-methyltransferase (adenine-specific)
MELRELAKLNYCKTKNGILLQGDCLEWMSKIPDQSIDMILCDLPYGTTACKWDSILPFDRLWEEYSRIVKKESPIVLFGSEPFSSLLRTSNLKMYKYDWVWNKKKPGNIMLGKHQPMKITETVSVFSIETHNYYPIMEDQKPRTGKTYGVGDTMGGGNYGDLRYYDKKYPKNLLEFSNANQKGKLHPTQKPVDLFEYLIKTYTNEGETILDNTAGSCTTAVAAENTNRKWICIEKELEYCEKSRKRLEDLGYLN